MSYQPTPIPVAPPPSRARGRGLIWLGVVLMVVGLGAGVAIYFVGQQRFDSRVESLASDSGALSGCITDLTFTKEGTFVLYYLSSGDVQVNGSNDDCAGDDVVAIDADQDPPDMEVTLTDSDGDSVRLSQPAMDKATSVSAGGVTAWPYRQASIESTGDYQIEITADDDVPRFAIGLGPEIQEPDVMVPILVAAIGLALGALLMIIGGARGRSAKYQPEGTAVGYGYPGAPAGFQGPGQYPAQPPVVYQPPSPQGFDHPTRSLPPIVASPEPVGPFATPPGGPPPGLPTQPMRPTPGQPLPPPPAPGAAPAPAPRPPSSPVRDDEGSHER